MFCCQTYNPLLIAQDKCSSPEPRRPPCPWRPALRKRRRRRLGPSLRTVCAGGRSRARPWLNAARVATGSTRAVSGWTPPWWPASRRTTAPPVRCSMGSRHVRGRVAREGGRGGGGRPSVGRLLRYRDGTLVRRQARQSARARRRRDYAALDEGQPSDAAPPFEALLRARRFLPAPVAVVDGATLTADVLRVRGFVEPMMVAGDAAAMGMAMPPAPFTVDDVVRLVGNPHPPPPPPTHTRPGVTCAGVVSRFADAEVGQGRAARCP
jgi:hypothetical protein